MHPERKLKPVKVVLATSNKERPFTVSEPRLVINPGDELEFIFEGCRNPTIMIPVSGVMQKRIAVPRADEPGVIRMRVLDNPDMSHNTFAYAVYSTEIDDFAVGNSPPRMVLDSGPKP